MSIYRTRKEYSARLKDMRDSVPSNPSTTIRNLAILTAAIVLIASAIILSTVTDTQLKLVAAQLTGGHTIEPGLFRALQMLQGFGMVTSFFGGISLIGYCISTRVEAYVRQIA